ncbi:MAG TPA: glycosyltransferase family 1 protein [Azospirillaceae bacterium]|nr:glycosyltransferase family 1 protein [Azospirillaceae bacterium]
MSVALAEKPVAAAPLALARRTLVINGRFLSQRLTGVQRYARELVGALDAKLAERAAAGDVQPAIVHAPPDAKDLEGLRHIGFKRVGRHTGHAWEQLDLGPSAKGALLLNLGNTGPLLHPNQIVAIHDAGIYACPESYSKAFRAWYRLQYAVLGRRAKRVLTVSRFSAGELAFHAHIHPGRLAVVPNAADHFAAQEPDEGALARFGLEPGGYIFALGSLSRAKNTAAVAKALALLPGPKPLLVTAGHRDPRIFADAGAAPGEGVKELGPVSDAELKALYGGALCLVFPSLYEGFGLPPLEAMIAGCPVIAARAASLPEVCGQAALYADPHDPQDIARQIARVLSDPDLRRTMAAQGRERARAFGWRQSADALLTILDEVQAS